MSGKWYSPRCLCAVSHIPSFKFTEILLKHWYKEGTIQTALEKPLPLPRVNHKPIRLQVESSTVSYGGNDEDWNAIRKIGWLIGARGIMELFNAVLTEQKTLIVSADKALLGQACYIASLLLSPMKWCGIYIPLLPEQIHNVIESPTPFIVGMTSIEGFDIPDVSLITLY